MKKYANVAITHLFLLTVAAITLFPLVYTLSASFKSNMEVILGGANLIPKEFTFQNYVNAWKLANFQVYTWNSLVISFFTIIGGIIISTMTAYVFTRGKFRGKRILFWLYLGTMFISVGAITLYPISQIANAIGILNTTGIIIVQIYSVGAFNLFLALGYFKTINRPHNLSFFMEQLLELCSLLSRLS